LLTGRGHPSFWRDGATAFHASNISG
jgi:hypothetical protein